MQYRIRYVGDLGLPGPRHPLRGTAVDLDAALDCAWNMCKRGDSNVAIYEVNEDNAESLVGILAIDWMMGDQS